MYLQWHWSVLKIPNPMLPSAHLMCGLISCHTHFIFPFVDNPTPLTQRQNWNKETLHRLLESAGDGSE